MYLKYSTTLGNKEWLSQKYEIEQLSTHQISRIVGCEGGSVYKWLLKHRIDVRSKSQANGGVRNPMFGRLGVLSPTFGIPCNEERKRKISFAKKGKKLTLEHRMKIASAQIGEKCHFWKGGITQTHLKIRNSLEYRVWRETVFKRDGYTCQTCGDAQGGNLQADHIKPFSRYPDLRFAIDNGRTLCIPCHRKTDTYGSKALNK